MKHRLIIAFLFIVTVPCAAQQFQIVSPDSSIVKSMSIDDYISVVTTARGRFDGQLTGLAADAITINHRGRSVNVLISEIAKARKTSKFGIGLARLSPYAAVVPIAALPSANSPTYQDRTWANRFLVRAAVIIPSSVVLGLLMNNSFSFRKAKNGYSFRVIP